jgi:hypothetical protein
MRHVSRLNCRVAKWDDGARNGTNTICLPDDRSCGDSLLAGTNCRGTGVTLPLTVWIFCLCALLTYIAYSFYKLLGNEIKFLLLPMARQPLGGLGRLIFRGFAITHTLDTPQSVGLLWTRDQLVAETSTWQHTTLTTDKHPCPRWDFFCLSGVFPLWSIFVLFKSFRPSCHFTFQITVLTTNTTQTSMPPVGFFFY